MKSGSVNYQSLLEDGGILVIADSENLLKKIYGAEFRIGDSISVTTYGGLTRSYVVQGIIDGIKTGGDAFFFILPEPSLHDLYPQVSDFTYAINVHVTEDSQRLREAVYETAKDPGILVVSLQDLADSLAPQMATVLRAAYGMALFLFLFALLNLVNTLITNLLARRQELGVFQSVGMGRGQLSLMLSGECLLYVGGTLLITLTAGTLCGMILCRVLEQAGAFGQMAFRFPLMEVSIFTAAMLAVQLVFSLAAARYCGSLTLVDRIKATE